MPFSCVHIHTLCRPGFSYSNHGCLHHTTLHWLYWVQEAVCWEKGWCWFCCLDSVCRVWDLWCFMTGKLWVFEAEIGRGSHKAWRESFGYSQKSYINRFVYTKTQSRDVSHSSLSHPAVSLSSLPHTEANWTEFGSILFTKCVSGTRSDI